MDPAAVSGSTRSRPGVTRTDALAWFPDNQVVLNIGRKMGERLGQLAGKVDDVADAVLLLVSEQAR